MKDGIAILEWIRDFQSDIICTMPLVFSDLGLAATSCFICKFTYLIHLFSFKKFPVAELLVSAPIFLHDFTTLLCKEH